MNTLLLSSLVILVAAIIQGTAGFGFSLVAAPLLALLLPIKEIVPMLVCYSLVTNIMVVRTTRKHIKLRHIWVMILTGIIGIPIGVYGLKNFDPQILKIVIGILILVTTIIIGSGFKIRFKNEHLSFGIAGFISGVLNGSLAMSGPPIVLFLSNSGYNKDEFRANLTTYAVITNIMTIVSFIFYGLISMDMVKTMGMNIFALFIGSFIGLQVASKIKDQHFKKVVLVLLSILSIVTIIKAL